MTEEEKGLPIGSTRMPDYLRPTYANFANVNFTPWDFRITFCVVKTPLPGDEAAAAKVKGYLEPEAERFPSVRLLDPANSRTDA